jgi:alpha-amylase/alpha-mannosidase (GH57 family)
MSITESFFDDRLLEEIELELGPTRSPSIAAMWDDAAIGATGSWSDRRQRYKRWLGLNPNWQFVEDLAEARNAVAHGVGSLTRRQLRNASQTTTSLSRIGINLTGNRLTYDDSTLRAIANRCIERISEVDELVENRP